jgi:hypothetical protein
MSNRRGGIDGGDEALRSRVSDVRTEDLDGHLPHRRREKKGIDADKQPGRSEAPRLNRCRLRQETLCLAPVSVALQLCSVTAGMS